MRNTLVLIMGAAGHAQHALRVRERRRTGTRRGSSVGNPRAPSPRHPSAPALPVARVAHGPASPRDGRCGLATTATECADGGHRMLRFSNGRVQEAGGLRRARLGVPTVMGGADVRAAFRRLLMHSSEGVAR